MRRPRWILLETIGKRRRVVVVWKIIALVSPVPAIFQRWGEGLRWWAKGAESFSVIMAEICRRVF